MKKNKRFTVMYIPHYGSDPRSFNLSLKTLYVGITVLTIFLAAFVSFLTLWGSHYGFMLAQMEELEHLRMVNKVQEDQILSLSEEADLISDKMKALEELDREIREILQLEDFQDIMSDVPPDRSALLSRGLDYSALDFVQKKETELEAGIGGIDNDMQPLFSRLEELSGDIPVTRAALEELKILVEEKKEELAGTPSIWPTTGRVTSPFGERRSPFSRRLTFHNGIDIGAKRGTPVYAAARGVVETAAYNGGMGRMVSISHPYGHRTVYAHLTSYVVAAGDSVEKGDLIGHVGSTGYSTGPHLHYEVHVNGVPQDPMLFLPKK